MSEDAFAAQEPAEDLAVVEASESEAEAVEVSPEAE